MATYIRLTDYKDSDSKEQGFFKPENRYEAKQEDFAKIPGSPIAYWVSKRVGEIFFSSQKIREFTTPKQGMATSDNNRFLKLWYEVSFDKIGLGFSNRDEAKESSLKWFPYNKGGETRKWYGNFDYVVNWEDDGKEIKNFRDYKNSTLSSNMGVAGLSDIFKSSVSWSKVSTSGLALRYYPQGCLFDVAGCCLFSSLEYNKYFMSVLNSKLEKPLISSISPTINFEAGQMAEVPIIFPKSESTKQLIDTLTQECIDISKEEWDSRETSWDFKKNELVRILGSEALASHSRNNELGGVKTPLPSVEMGGTKVPLPRLEEVYNRYCAYWREKFYKLHKNEEELNRLFIDIYELHDELTPEVALKDITILKSEADIVEGELVFNSEEIIKQFISYAIGCMFGRYSLDKEGLQIANLGSDTLVSHMSDETKVSFPIDDDNVIPVLEDDYFGDDIASRVVNFVKTSFGSENLSENINFIEKCLGKTVRAYMVKDFYEDHIKRYKKRPIYWMVASPKKGFMSLSYMHRYQSDIFARVQNNYLREYITKLEGTKEILNQTLLSDTASSKDKKEADKKIKAIEVKLKELIAFDRDTLTNFAQNRVGIDLDDGVKVNYCKFSDVLYEIKGLC